MDTGNSLGALEGVTQLILHHAHDTMGLLGGVSGVTHDVLVAQLGSLGSVEGLLGGQRGADTAGQVGEDLVLMVDVVTGDAAAGVGQNLIGYPLTGGELHSVVGGSLTGGEDQLSGLDHQVTILEVHEDHIVIVEGNYDEMIHWGRTMTREECLESYNLYTRYPENYPFADVPKGVFYSEPVAWAVENGITTGASANTFNPNGECMRAHVVTFLWRAAGQPEPTTTENPFVDVKTSDFFYKAVLWAVENGVTNGVDATHFGPTVNCNRAQVVTFLYRAMGSPEISTTESAFTDVQSGQWYEQAVLWAVENAVTNGMSADTFGTDGICNRAQVVTFLYRTYVD